MNKNLEDLLWMAFTAGVSSTDAFKYGSDINKASEALENDYREWRERGYVKRLATEIEKELESQKV